MKSQIKMMLNISVADVSKDQLIDTLINISQSKILPLLDSPIVPLELEFIIVEMTINRFNKLGSEGINSESVAEISRTYSNSVNELEPYMTYINEFNKASKSKFRFL